MIYYFDLRPTPIFRDAFRESGVIQQNQFRNWPAMFAVRHHVFTRLPSVCFYPRPRFARGDDKIILFDSYTDARLLRWLCRHYPDKRIIFWYWNPVHDPERMKAVPPGVEIWSFSRADSRRYGLRFNTQFFFDSLVPAAESPEREPAPMPKALFLGREKGRREQLYHLAEELREAGAEVDLRINPEPKGRFRALREKLIPYGKVIELAREADVLIDYVNDSDTGLTLRCIEALFLAKKLITNNREILEADFYDPANIYVLGQDDRELKEFLSSPMRTVDPKIRDRYLLSRWLERFDTEGEIP